LHFSPLGGVGVNWMGRMIIAGRMAETQLKGMESEGSRIATQEYPKFKILQIP